MVVLYNPDPREKDSIFERANNNTSMTLHKDTGMNVNEFKPESSAEDTVRECGNKPNYACDDGNNDIILCISNLDIRVDLDEINVTNFSHTGNLVKTPLPKTITNTKPKKKGTKKWIKVTLILLGIAAFIILLRVLNYI
jgi:hypothetical protein